MGNITIGQIASAIGLISVIATFAGGIIVSLSKWWKAHVANEFVQIDNRLSNAEKDILSLKDKKEKFVRIAQESKEERVVLLEGLLACLESLKKGETSELVTQAINKINTYLLDKLKD